MTAADESEVLSPEAAAHELVELCHLQPRTARHAQSVCSPHYFMNTIPYGERWSALLPGKDVLLPLEQDPFDDDAISHDELREAVPRIDLSTVHDGCYRAAETDEQGCFNDCSPLFDNVRFAFRRVRDRTWNPGMHRNVHPAAMHADRLIQTTWGILQVDGTWRSFGCWCGYIDGCWYFFDSPRSKRWRELPTRMFDSQVNAMLHGFEAAFALRYEWQLVFGREECASAAVPVERDALPDLVRLREVPEGKKRRAALANFVAAHRRRGRSQAPNEEPGIWVRKHMRGERFFRWDGLVVEVRPPVFDMEQLAKQERAS